MINKPKTIAFLGVCTALALVLSYIEVILPPVFPAIPGIKMGLPNIIIVFLLYRRGPSVAVIVSLLRILLVSLLIMMLLRRLNFLSTVGVSVAGGVSHNVGQILMAMLLLETAELGYYLVVLTVTGTISGILIGLCGATLIKRVPKNI